MSRNQELHNRQELIVELYNHTINQLCRDNVGDFKDRAAVTHDSHSLEYYKLMVEYIKDILTEREGEGER